MATSKEVGVNPNLKPLESLWEWQYKGNCVKSDPETFFLDTNVRSSKKAAANDAAKAICKGCPVIAECLQHALTVPEEYGVWGGMTIEERKEIRVRITKYNGSNTPS
jgi:WhiB family redox-sensing transcriptional regulator